MDVRLTLASLLVMSGCGVDLDDTARDDHNHDLGGAVEHRPIYGGGCHEIECGENAATAGDGLLFDELNLAGEANWAGTMLVRTTYRGHPAKLDIQGPQIIVTDLVTHAIWGSTDVEGTILTFKHVSGEEFQILINKVDKQDVSYQSQEHDIVPIYEMLARRSSSKKFDFYVCNHDLLVPDPSWVGHVHYALAYRGDRYDGDAKKVLDIDPSEPWAFLACNGSAATKMQLWRHTYAGEFRGDFSWRWLDYPISFEKRTTLLKAITADYCGDGTSFTVTGTPLTFATSSDPTAFNRSPDPRDVRSVEAMWSHEGVICLDEPRLADRDEVERQCGRKIPSCADYGAILPNVLPPNWYDTAHVITANPR